MNKIKRYNLALPVSIFNRITEIAAAEATTFLEAIRKLIKIGLYLYQQTRTPDTHIIIREAAGSEKEIVLDL
jgi:hypothetical protein